MDYEPPPAETPAINPSVIVAGGGLAGMTAAWRLAAAGCRVTLIERRPCLGGRAYSFTDPGTGAQIDNGQHVFMACCRSYINFLRDIGSLQRTTIQPRLRVEVRSPSGKLGALAASPLPSPFHLLPSFLRYPHLNWREKLRVALALNRIKRDNNPERDELRRLSFHQWLRRNNQSNRAIANFWELIIRPALNDAPPDVPASLAISLLRTALLTDPHAADLGFARTSLSDIMGDPVEQRLRDIGVRLLLGRSLQRIDIADGVVASVALVGGDALSADWCVSALPPQTLLGALPDSLRAHPAFAPAATHTFAPIVNLHIWYDRPVADFEWTAFVDSPLQFVFNRSRIAGNPARGDYLVVSLSGAWEWWPMPKAQLRERFTAELQRALPRARSAVIERFLVVKEQRATFRSLPGGPRNRLPPATPLPNLVLAGDWTDTGWPATMEGAVRSGDAAAAIVLASPR